MKKPILFILALLTSTAWAETLFVTDQFRITMRSGESATHRIKTMLPTGAPLEVLSSNPKNGYSKVRTKGGAVGYVLTRQLLKEPVAREQLAEMKAKIEALEAAPSELQSKLSSLTEQHSELSSAHKKLQDIKRDIEQQLAALKRTSTNAVRISNERNELRKQVVSLTRSGEELKQQNRELENNSAQRWFMIGAGVLIGGVLIGLILPHLRLQRRKDSWGSL